MTREICAHHLGLYIWIAADIILFICLAFATVNFSHYNFTVSDYIFPNYGDYEKYNASSWASNQFYFFFVFTIIINLMALYVANMRYSWFGIKSCD